MPLKYATSAAWAILPGHDFPDISLVISVPGTENAFLNGESTGPRITAELTGSGFDTQTIVFTKTGTGT